MSAASPSSLPRLLEDLLYMSDPHRILEGIQIHCPRALTSLQIFQQLIAQRRPSIQRMLEAVQLIKEQRVRDIQAEVELHILQELAFATTPDETKDADAGVFDSVIRQCEPEHPAVTILQQWQEYRRELNELLTYCRTSPTLTSLLSKGICKT